MPGEAKDIELPLSGKRVVRFCVERGLSLEFSEHERLVVGVYKRFLLCGGGGEQSLSAEDLGDAAKAIVLVRKVTKHGVARRNGTLEISFADGYELSVPPDPQSDAWKFSGTDILIGSDPGGGLTVFRRPGIVPER